MTFNVFMVNEKIIVIIINNDWGSFIMLLFRRQNLKGKSEEKYTRFVRQNVSMSNQWESCQNLLIKR